MRTKKSFTFDEEKQAEEIIEKGVEEELDYGKMYVIAKYFREKFGYGQIRLEKELIHFCKERDKNFNPVLESKLIKKWVTSAMNYSLRKIEEIHLTENEMKTLREIDEDKDRKIIYATLVLSKGLKQRSTRKNKENLKKSSNFYVKYSNFHDIIKLSRVSITEKNLAILLGKYTGTLVSLYSPERELIKILFAEEGNDDYIIENTENIMEFYENIFGNRPLCTVCGKPFEKKSNRQKACPSCTKELNRKRVENFRKRQKTKM